MPTWQTIIAISMLLTNEIFARFSIDFAASYLLGIGQPFFFVKIKWGNYLEKKTQ